MGKAAPEYSRGFFYKNNSFFVWICKKVCIFAVLNTSYENDI